MPRLAIGNHQWTGSALNSCTVPRKISAMARRSCGRRWSDTAEAPSRSGCRTAAHRPRDGRRREGQQRRRSTAGSCTRYFEQPPRQIHLRARAALAIGGRPRRQASAKPGPRRHLERQRRFAHEQQVVGQLVGLRACSAGVGSAGVASAAAIARLPVQPRHQVQAVHLMIERHQRGQVALGCSRYRSCSGARFNHSMNTWSEKIAGPDVGWVVTVMFPGGRAARTAARSPCPSRTSRPIARCAASGDSP